MTLSRKCSVTRFNLETIFVLEKKIFKCFSPYMDMAAILFKNAELFEQIGNTPSTESPV